MANAFLWLPRALWKIYYLIFFSATLVLLYPFFYITLSKAKWFKYTFQLMRFWAFLLQVFGGIFMKVEGRKNVPKNTGYVICANHSSYLDIILMYRVFRKYFVFMGKKELESWPLFNIFFTKGMNILVDRGSRIAASQSLNRAEEEIERIRPVVIFPEATIPKTAPKLKGFKNGAFKLAIEKQVPIVPVTFTNNWALLQGSVMLKGKAGPGFTRAIIHPPVETKGLSQDDLVNLRSQVFDIIEAPLKKHYGSNG